ncbi:MAG: hypothetical protein K6B72_05155 [Lachnospiraceae bacterium]|nr:hypothetical protein [Lachnospiraceae bacterium]
MSRIFVIPDVHLKLWIFARADELVSAGSYDAVVMLGDLVDDWGMQLNTELYNGCPVGDEGFVWVDTVEQTWARHI